MEKILPFNCETPVKTYSYFADYLGALEANGYEIKNLLEEHFMFLSYIPFTGQVNFQFKKSLKHRIGYENFDVNDIEPLSFIKNNIIKNKYIVIFLDDNFFQIDLKQKIGVHNWLVYGFDEEKEIIYIVGYVFDKNCGAYKNLTISFSEFEKSVAKKLTLIEKNRISANHIFGVPDALQVKSNVKYGCIKKIAFYCVTLNVFKLLIVHNFIYSHLNFNPYKRGFLDLRDLRIIFEQTRVFSEVIVKKNNNYFREELNELMNVSESMLMEAAFFLYRANRNNKIECAKSINRKLYKIYKIEKKLFKSLFIK